MKSSSRVATLLSMDIVPTSILSSPRNREGSTFVAGVGEKGKITIPSQVRQLLNLHPKDKIIIRIEKGRAIIEGKLPSVEETAGIVPTLAPAREQKKIEETVRDKVTQRYRDKSK